MGAITIKNQEEIGLMREAGRLAADVLDMITPYVKAGVSTNQLNDICHDYIVHVQKAIPAPLHYRGYPKSICTSVNQQVCHGIPNDRTLKKGDILNIDVTVIKNGFHGDTSRMFYVGTPSVLAKRLCEVTRECMYVGIRMVKPGVHLGDIGAAIAQHAHQDHFTVVEEFCGHGIGREFHEEPQVLHYGVPGKGEILRAGMTFTIEPMINAGKRYIKILPDEWTAVTKDHSLSAQWEHTILVTSSGHEILTLSAAERALSGL